PGHADPRSLPSFPTRRSSDLGRPIALSVFPGNTGDPSTLMPQVAKLKEQYGLNVFTLVGDRGMITCKHLPALRAAGVDWVTALKDRKSTRLNSSHVKISYAVL